MQLVISDPKKSMAYSKAVEDITVFLNKKIGETVELGFIGLDGFEARISGGSDKTGTPMRADLPGTARKKILLAGPPGFNPKRKGERKRISVRGNTVAQDINQLNVVITKYGAKNLDEMFPKKEKKQEISVKEEMVQKSLEAVGTGDIDPKTVKGKVKKT